MSNRRWLCCCLWTLCVFASSEGVVVAQDPAQPTRLRIFVDEQLIPDLVRAQVYELVALSVPESEWPTVTLTSATSLPTLLDDYFDIYSRGNGRTPRTQRTLSDMVVKANPGVFAAGAAGAIDEGSIKLPPLPIRAHSDYRLNDVDVRMFDPAAMSYALMSPAGTVVAAHSTEPPRVAESPELRRGKITELVITLNEAVKERLRRYRTSLSGIVAVDANEDGVATMRLLGAEQPAACDSAQRWLPGSPYFSSMRLALTPQVIGRIESAAANVPLTIIDWNVATGHGAKVRAVVTEVLAGLGIPQVDTRVQTVELNPARNRDGLRQMLQEYRAHLKQASGGADLGRAFDTAESWVKNHRPADEESPTQRVPSLVLQAVFWKQFSRAQVVNFSFTTDSAALTVLDANFMTGARAFGAMAAGNTGMPASPVMKPQAEAVHWTNVVNVTHGRPDGAIDGDVTNEQFKVVVNLVAPGCGYTTAPLQPADTGSSFASPYVATVAWVRMLLGVPVAGLKRSLITASHPLPAVGRRVESGGLFDPALFLLQPASHILTSQGAFLSLSSLRFTMTYQAEGTSFTIGNTGSADPTYVVTFHPCPDGSEACTTVRQWLTDGSLFMRSGPITATSFEAVSGQQQIVTTDPRALLKLVRLITF